MHPMVIGKIKNITNISELSIVLFLESVLKMKIRTEKFTNDFVCFYSCFLFFKNQKTVNCRAKVSLSYYIYTVFKQEIFDIYRNNIEYGDRSDVLMKQGYWPSYNIP